MGFQIYITDTETTGLDPFRNDIIELSIFRFSDEVQKTWFIKSVNHDTISPEALRVNGHKIEDITHKTKAGIEKYKDPASVIVEIENWMQEDGVSREDRIIAGQNIGFDIVFMREMWRRCNAEDTIPFDKKSLDTLQIVLLMDLISERKREYYNLSSLIKDFGIKKEKAHRADADVRMTKDLLIEIMDRVKNNKL